MLLETVESKGLAHLSYVLGDDNQGMCIVIDPRRDVSIYLDIARRNNCRITHIFETHIHADFVSGARELAAQSGAQIVGGVSDAYGFELHQAQDGETFSLGQLTIKVLATPGHTPEHISLLVSGGKGSHKPWAVFTGDTLFAGEVGRPDLLGAGSEQALARSLFHSLHDVLFQLGDEVEIYPAHGSGSPCGGSIGDRLTSTIGYERLNLPKAQIKDEDEFMSTVLADLPPAPLYYPRMKKINAQGATVLGCMRNLPPLDADRFDEARREGNTQIVDTREIEAFGGAHISGALNIALREEFPVWSGWMLRPDQKLLLVLTDEGDLDAVQRHLLRIGIENVVGFLRHGMRGWIEAGKPFETLPQTSVHTLKRQLDSGSGLKVLDVRQDGEWKAGHIQGATHIFVPELVEAPLPFAADEPVAVYCGSGYRASIAASVLQARGFQNVSTVPGSIKAWKGAGYELTKDGA
ncbi:MAG: hydroxyacylglutathione hydrolase [Abditibacteriota bacterium]|nr:hydroxyacylglutathione hydrolase [Abditibacteriota bacterium]